MTIIDLTGVESSEEDYTDIYEQMMHEGNNFDWGNSRGQTGRQVGKQVSREAGN